MRFSGLGMALTLEDASGTPVALSDAIGDINVTNSFGEQDITPISAFAMDRLQLVEDSVISITGQGFPPDAIMTCLTVTPRLPAAGREVVITYPNGWTYTVMTMIFSFSPARPQDGGITWGLEVRLTGGTPGVWASS